MFPTYKAICARRAGMTVSLSAPPKVMGTDDGKADALRSITAAAVPLSIIDHNFCEVARRSLHVRKSHCQLRNAIGPRSRQRADRHGVIGFCRIGRNTRADRLPAWARARGTLVMISHAFRRVRVVMNSTYGAPGCERPAPIARRCDMLHCTQPRCPRTY